VALCTVQELRSWLGIADSSDDAELSLARDAAQDAVRSYCGYSFELDAGTSAKVFVASSPKVLDLGAVGTSIGSSTGLAIATDVNDVGTFSQAWTSSDWQLEPLNGTGPGGATWPTTQIRAIGDHAFPVGGSGRARVRVTARWGWPAVPSRVQTATILLAAAWHQRRMTMAGRGGFEGFFQSAIRDDQTIADLLDPFRHGTAVVGVA
jgi:hypothetical protein